MPFYRWVVGDLRTGKINRVIDLPDGKWSADIDDDGTIDGSFNLASGEWPTARADAAPAKSFLAVAYVDRHDREHWKAGGPIWTAAYTDSSGKLTLGAAALSSYFDHRKAMPVIAAGINPALVNLSYDTAQLALIAKRLIESSREHTGGDLPIVFPSDAELGGEGLDRTRTYPGYELGWVGTRLTQLTQVIAGPEVQFEPRRRADDPRYVEWVMRIGTEETGTMLSQSGSPWVFDRTVPQSPVTNIDVDVDGSEVSFRSWAAGEGEGEGRPIVFVDSDEAWADNGWPLLESEVTSLDSVSRTETLIGHASNDLQGRKRPVEMWDVSVARDAEPHVGRYRAGDWCLIRVRAHAYIPDGDYQMRILAISGSGTQPIKLSMAPRLGEF